MPQQPNYLLAAQSYIGRGWPVLPLAPGEKTPLTSHGFKDASTNDAHIVRWWDQWPDANIGVATGKNAGFWVLDIDGPTGSASLTELEQELGPLPDTLEQKTGGGGRHLFFKWSGARPIRNKQDLRDGIDVRGEGGYIVVPPSLHPNGQRYSWPYEDTDPIAETPRAWLEILAPTKKAPAPWENVGKRKQKAAPPPPAAVVQAPVIRRARAYLAECEPARQGNGGHNALLWAARALVTGFKLDDTTAIDLLWSDFNPRCNPPWDREKSADIKDFERKVGEARRTPSDKRDGWLLDEYGLRDSAEAMAQIAKGQASAESLLASASKPAVIQVKESEGSLSVEVEIRPFPVECFPGPIADYCRQVAQAHVVPISFSSLPILVVAGAAMGNVWRLKLKEGFVVPPILWGGIVAPSGANKSGPLNEIVEPLRDVIPLDQIAEPMLNPQGRSVVSDATLEAVIARLDSSKRGLLVFRDELAGWVKSFNSYKQKGGDEQAWLEFWGGKEYILDRKTNDEQIRIPAASCCILGGIQPSVLVECFDPGRFASGLVPRFLIACPPVENMYWSEAEVSETAKKDWKDAVHWLRTHPFRGLDPNAGKFLSHELVLSDEARVAYVAFFNDISHRMSEMDDEASRAVTSKARLVAGRLALIHHGLTMACTRADKIVRKVGLESVDAATTLAHWFLSNEQIRVFGFSADKYTEKHAQYLYARLVAKHPKDEIGVRHVQRANNKKYGDRWAAVAGMKQLVETGRARWTGQEQNKIVLILEEGK